MASASGPRGRLLTAPGHLASVGRCTNAADTPGTVAPCSLRARTDDAKLRDAAALSRRWWSLACANCSEGPSWHTAAPHPMYLRFGSVVPVSFMPSHAFLASSGLAAPKTSVSRRYRRSPTNSRHRRKPRRLRCRRHIARHDWASVRVAQARGACVRMALHAKVVTGRDSGDLWRCCLGPVLVYAHGLPSLRGPPSRAARNSGAQARPVGVRARGDHHSGGFTSDAELQRHQRDKRRLCNVLEPMVHRTRHTRCTPSARSQHCPPPALPRLHQGVCTSHFTAPHRTAPAPHSAQ